MAHKELEDRREYRKQWISRQDPNYSRNANLKRKYGITLEEYNEMFDKQGGLCMICERHQSELGATMHVDHCHTSGKVRGLLCNNCNIGIGALQDSPRVLESALYYILDHEPTGRPHE